MIKGIPYFGEITQELMDYILNTDFSNVPVARYKSLYEIVESSVNDKVVVVIDNKWVTWLNDIVFNYRDKECYLPYYSYEEYLITDRVFKTNNKGHLELTDDGLKIKYEYKYHIMTFFYFFFAKRHFYSMKLSFFVFVDFYCYFILQIGY